MSNSNSSQQDTLSSESIREAVKLAPSERRKSSTDILKMEAQRARESKARDRRASTADIDNPSICRKSISFLIDETTSILHSGSFEIPFKDLTVNKKLGEGEFGVVLKGSYKGQDCALKALKMGVSMHSLEYERIIMELAILASVGKHPNLVDFYGSCLQDPQTPIIVLEYMELDSLQKFINGKPDGFRLAHAKIHTWALDMLSGLEHLHGLDPPVIHRDLKPANLLLTRDHRLKITDFGLSTRCHRSHPSLHTCSVGTPRYTAPEVFVALTRDAHGRPALAAYTEKADIYSASLVLWYLLAGHKPRALQADRPTARPDLAAAARRWPELSALVEAMWAHDPAQRPTAAECCRRLRAMPAPPETLGERLSRGVHELRCRARGLVGVA